MQTNQKESSINHLLHNLKVPSYFQTLEGLWLLVIFWIPLYFNPMTYFEFYLNKALLIRFLSVCMLSLVVGHWVWKGGGKIDWRKIFFGTPLHIAVFVFGLAFSISTILSIDPVISFWGSVSRDQGWLTLAAWIIFFYIVSYYLRESRQFVRAVTVLLVSSGLVSILGIMQYYFPTVMVNFFQTQVDASHRIVSTAGNALSLSSFLAMSIPFNLGLSGYIWKNNTNCHRRLWLTLLVLMLVLQVWCLFLAQYSITILLFLVAPVIFFLIWGFLRSRIVAFVSLAGAILLVTIASVLIIPTFTSTVSTNNVSLYAAEPLSVESLGIVTIRDLRVHFWKNTAEVWWQSPQVPGSSNYPGVLRKAIGYGPENYLALIDQHYPETQATSTVLNSNFNDQPHDNYLYLLSTTGALGLIAYLAILVIFGLMAYRSIKNFSLKSFRSMGWFVIASAAAVVQYSADIIFNPTTISGDILFWFSLALIAALALANQSNSENPLNPSIPRSDLILNKDSSKADSPQFPRKSGLIFKALAGLIGITLIAFNTTPILTLFKADVTYEKATEAVAYRNPQSIYFLDEVTRDWPKESYYWGSKGWYIFNTEVSTNDTSVLDYCVGSYQQAIQHQPYFAYYYLMQAEVYSFWGRQGTEDELGNAYPDYQKADSLFPNNAVIQSKWALALYQGGFSDQALEHLKQSFMDDPNWFHEAATTENVSFAYFKRFSDELDTLNKYVTISDNISSQSVSNSQWMSDILSGIADYGNTGNDQIWADEMDKAIRAANPSEVMRIVQYLIEHVTYDPSSLPSILPFVSDWYAILEQMPGGAELASQLKFALSI